MYKLHKDNSPVVINCYSEEEQFEQLHNIVEQGYKNAYRVTPEHANKVLNDFGQRFKPKPLTKQEIWHNWTLGKG